MRILIATVVVCVLTACAPRVRPEQKAAALEAFATVEKVFQHPRCSNCHIPGDSPLQFDAQTSHTMNVERGPDGKGAPGLPCATCHADTNPPASYGAHIPPGAPHWSLPPPDRKMAWIGVPAHDLCEMIKDPARNGGRDSAALLKHVSDDELVMWGWQPGAGRAPVPVPHDQLVAAFKLWLDAGSPCPDAAPATAMR